MEFENEPIEKSKKVVSKVFSHLLKREDLLPEEWDKSFVYLIGIAIWDIFSNNHEVISPHYKVYDIGSWRGSGQTISEIINDNFSENESYGYLDFYMGGFLHVDNDFSLLKIYEEIFRVLKELKCDWNYSFPRTYLVDFKESDSDNEKDNNMENLFYDPNESIEKELAKKKRKEQLNEFQKELDKDFQRRLEKAKKEPLPEIIRAFINVYGYMPKGSQF